MDVDPRNFFNSLYNQLENENSGPALCKQILTNFNEALTQSEINVSLLELYLQHMFRKAHGFLKFVTDISNKKEFKSSGVTVFEIIYTLLNNFPTKLDRYIFSIHEICLKVIKSFLASADIKAKALDVLILTFGHTNKSIEKADHYRNVLFNLENGISMKKPPTVEEKLFAALGSFAKNFPLLVQDFRSLREKFLSSLGKHMNQQDFSYKSVAGLFSGLDAICESFPFNPNEKEDQLIISHLCAHIYKLSVSTSTIKVANRAALTFLTNNILLFVHIMVKQYRVWHTNLLVWLTYGAEDVKVGVASLQAFYLGLGIFFLDAAIVEEYGDALTYFVEYFTNILQNSDSMLKRKLALTGLSLFAEACSKNLGENELKAVLLLIIHGFEQIYILKQDLSSEDLEYLPNYLKTLVRFTYLRRVTQSELFCLQKGVITLMKLFPDLPYREHENAIDALIMIFYCLSKNNVETFLSFLQHSVYQGVIWTCSHQHISEAEMFDESTQKTITIINYLPLWKGLLKIVPARRFDKIGIYLEDRTYIVGKIIDKLIKSLLQLVNKLNVSWEPTQTEGPVTNYEIAFKLTRVDDFGIYLNLVDFYGELFEAMESTVLKQNVWVLVKHFMNGCIRCPLVSGNYKLLSFILKIAHKMNYFEESYISSVLDAGVCYASLKDFVDIVLSRIEHYKGDLLIATLQVLLHYPISIMKHRLPACVSVFTTIFAVGLTYTKLTHLAIETLEFWLKEMPHDEIQSFLIQIVPLLDTYLQSKSVGVLQVNTTKRKSAQMLKKRKVIVEVEPDLMQLQMKILQFVGQQSSTVCKAFVDSEASIEFAIWGSKQYLKVVLPFQDIKLDIYLDKLVPRIINVALTSTDRKTRILACELFHAVVMVFLGTTKTMTHSAQSDISELLRHFVVPLMKLGCDMDQVVEQLFQPLCLQFIHWYTHKLQITGEHSRILVDGILESITHPNNAALRDFAGRCIREYVKWVIKQTSKKNLAKDPESIEYLTEKMHFFATHPKCYKKLGAALIFNNIYQELREETALLSMFWIEFLSIFVQSLESFEIEKEEHSTEQINFAIKHIERGFVEKAYLFNKIDNNRKVPNTFQGGLLSDVSLWLFSKTNSKSIDVRRNCMELFRKITPLTTNFTSLEKFLAEKIKEDSWIVQMYESYIQHHATLESVSGYKTEQVIQWMQGLLTALDGHYFVLNNDLVISTQTLLTESVVNAVIYYIRYVSTKTLEETLDLIDDHKKVYTTFDRQVFDKLRCEIVIRILELLDVHLLKDRIRPHLSLFYGPHLWNLLVNIIFNREQLGFNVYFTNDKVVNSLFRELMKYLPGTQLFEAVVALNDYVEKNWLYTNVDLKNQIELKQRSIIKGLLILQSFQLKHLNFQQCKHHLVNKLLTKFCEEQENNVIYAFDLQDTALQYCLSILDFALDSETEMDSLYKCLYKPYHVISEDCYQPIRFGSYILKLFGESIIPRLASTFEKFLWVCGDYDNLAQTTEIMLLVLQHLEQRPVDLNGEAIVAGVLFKWELVEKCIYEDASTLDLGIKFLKMLLPFAKRYKLNIEPLKKLLKDLLTFNTNLYWKDEFDLKVDIFHIIGELFTEADVETFNLQYSWMVMKERFFGTAFGSMETKNRYLNKLFSILPKTTISYLVRFLLDLKAEVSIENDDAPISTYLTQHIRSVDVSVQENTLTCVYSLFYSDPDNSVKQYNLITHICTLFHNCDESVFVEFFTQNISKFLKVLKKQTDQRNLSEKILHFSLLEVLFLRHPIDINGSLSPIAQAAISEHPTNKVFVSKLLKYTFDAIKDEVKPNTDLFRLYKCHSYNASVAIISNSVTDGNFYTKLFVRQDNGKDVLWNSLIDKTKTFMFEAAFDDLPKQRKILLNIRDKARKDRKLHNNQTQSVRYLESQRVYNSSLSEDITHFDFTNTIMRDQNEESDTQHLNMHKEIELDNTDVNTHSCMGVICGLIQHIFEAGIYSFPDEGTNDNTIPPFITGIVSLLLSEQTHKNIKIFWVKVIENNSSIFKHYAKVCLQPLLKFIVDSCAGNDINYFITDVVSVLAMWSAETVPQTAIERNLAGQLLNFFINNLTNERQDMFKYHLELLRVLIESWKSIILVPYDLISSKLLVDPTSRKVEIGVHLVSIFLANKIAPWKGTHTDYCKTLFQIIMKSKLKATYRPCAETVGLLLNFIRNTDGFKKVSGNTHVLLGKIKEPEKFALTFEALVIHYPEIADEFHLNIILNRIQEIPKLKPTYLRIILKRCDVLRNVAEFKNENWSTYIENENVEIQLLTLELVHKSLSVMSTFTNFKEIIEAVCKQVSNPNVLCRVRMYDIAIDVFEQFQHLDDVIAVCQSALVQGIKDSDAEISERIFDFWKSSSVIPIDIKNRYSYVLNKLYRSETENDFLGYGSYLLLEVLKRTEEYKSILFENPLEDCEFMDYHLLTNWRFRHRSFLPLFTASVASSSLSVGSMQMNQLRQTAESLEFIPTQTQREKELSQYSQAESSLLIKKPTSNDVSFVNPNLVKLSYKYQVAKKRFLKDREKISKYFAQHEVQKSINRVRQRTDQIKEKENKVVLYRSYRQGDLPDVQITLEAVLKPLQMLALNDGEIGRILCLELFNCITKKQYDYEFMMEISQAILNIFENSFQFNKSLFRALIDMLLNSRSLITISPELVASVAQSSGLTTLGIVVLENYLTNYEEEETSKRTKGGIATVNMYWIKLAELYKDLCEWDAVKSIFLEKLECPDLTKEAILSESNSQWRDAQDLYKNLITTDEAPERKDFYYESYFKCFGYLGEWKELVTSIDSVVSGPEQTSWRNLWDQDWNQKKLMPSYISGQLKFILSSKLPSIQFLMDLNNSLDSDQLDYLQNNFSEELAVFYIFQREVEEAAHYLKLNLKNFVEHWQQLDPLYSNMRYNKILRLQNVVDIQKFVNVFLSTNIDNQSEIEALISYWNRTGRDTLPSIILTEDRVLYRRLFMELLKLKIERSEEDYSEKLAELTQAKVKLLDGLLNLAITQNNFYMARKCLKDQDNRDKLKSQIYTSKAVYIKTHLLQNSSEKLEMLFNGCKPLLTVFREPCRSNLKLSAYVQFFAYFNQISSILSENEKLLYEKRDSLSSIMNNMVATSANDVGLYGAEKLRAFLGEYERELNERMHVDNDKEISEELSSMADAYVQLAYFTKSQSQESFSNFLYFVLRAMKYNSMEGRQLFPCILMAKEFTQEDTQRFIKDTESIPTWMFLGWIPQILVNVETSKQYAVVPLVLRIANTYPQAIMYAYNLSKENFKWSTNPLTCELDLLLPNKQMNKFLRGLSFVAVPAEIFLYYIKKLKSATQNKDSQEIENICNIILDELFSSTNEFRGNAFRKLSKYENAIRNFKCSRSKDVTVLNQIYDEVRQISASGRLSTKLEDYCPWLANLTANQENFELEIPGQYDGKKLPLVQYHVKISGFSSEVKIMTSLRKPIRVVIIGNDTKEYPYLVKFGEDVRQDQRIEQMFILMNNIFENDENLTNRQLSILTYQVIPLKASLGIIQWVENTTKLKDFMQKAMDNPNLVGVTRKAHAKWIDKTDKLREPDAYWTAASKFNRNSTIAKYRELVNMLPFDILKSALIACSSNTESFFAMRDNFIKTYAVICVAQWILGVGDRHLENFLVCLKNGKILGIDFGHAFGTATQILPVPELVPFRLTPHIIALMEPLGDRGLFREIMIHSMGSLRRNSAPLLATMDVFIEEPSIDWLEFASRRRDSGANSVTTWSPAKKINQARRKLKGAKSTTIMTEDLIAAHLPAEYKDAYIKLVQGVQEYDVRARFENELLSVEDQVDCLLDHATDYNLLGRMYGGWEAWI